MTERKYTDRTIQPPPLEDNGELGDGLRRVTPHQRQFLDLSLRQIVKRGVPGFAVTETALPGEVLFAIIRDPAAGEMSRVVVLCEKTLTDEAVTCARAALFQSELRCMNVKTRTVIYVRSFASSDDVGSSSAEHVLVPKLGMAKRILDASITGHSAQIPEFGAVRIVRP